MNKDVRQPKKKKEIELFVARSGPKKGKPECEAAFLTKDAAVEFLVCQHGLTSDEAKKLAKERKLTLKTKWHGAEQCWIDPETMSPSRAKQALSGEMYLPKVKDADLPTPRAISMKITLNIKLKGRKPVRKRTQRKSAKPGGPAPKKTERLVPKPRAKPAKNVSVST